MTVYSCAPFFNEFHLLDLKIAEEIELVDRLVISESDMTFQGGRKPLHLKGNPRYEHPKIGLVLLENRFTDRPWDNEDLQRNALLQPFEDDDVFIVTDLDEINNRDDIPMIVELARAHGHVTLEQALYYYKINLRVRGADGEMFRWAHAFAVTGRYLRETQCSFRDLRRKRSGHVAPTKGKHFSYLADAEGIAEKIKSFSHAEFNTARYTDPAKIDARIRNNVDPFEREFELQRVEIDDSYPKSILENMEFWRQYVA